MTPTSFTRLGALHDREPSTNEDYEVYIYLVTERTGTPQNIADDGHSEMRWLGIVDALHQKLAHRKYPESFERLDAETEGGSTYDER